MAYLCLLSFRCFLNLSFCISLFGFLKLQVVCFSCISDHESDSCTDSKVFSLHSTVAKQILSQNRQSEVFFLEMIGPAVPVTSKMQWLVCSQIADNKWGVVYQLEQCCRCHWENKNQCCIQYFRLVSRYSFTHHTLLLCPLKILYNTVKIFYLEKCEVFKKPKPTFF